MLIIASIFIAFNWKKEVRVIGSSDTDGIFQIYFFSNSQYTENKSFTSNIEKNEIFEINVSIPAGVDKIRIDPLNKKGDIEIYSISVGEFFLNKGNEFLNKIPYKLNSINMLEFNRNKNNSLYIKSKGNDPSFEIDLEYKNNLFLRSIVFYYSIIAIFSLLVLFDYKYRFLPTKFFEYFFIFSVPFGVALIFSAIFYPGFLNYDGLHALRGAIYGVKDSIWPPMVSYIWYFLIIITPDIWGMFFFQIYLLLISFYVVIFYQTKSVIYASFALVLFMVMPYISGTMAVIFKDVLMASIFIFAICCIQFLEAAKRNFYQIILISLILALLFLGICIRHNGMAGAVPIIFYLSMEIRRRYSMPGYLVLVLFIAMCSVIYYPKIFLDNYSLPTLTRLESPNEAFYRNVHVMDLAGASICAKENLFSKIDPTLKVEEISEGYDPRHMNLSLGILSRVGVGDEIDALWYDAIKNHPFCFLSNKLWLAKYLIGLNYGEQYIVTNPSIVDNEFDIKLQNSSIRNFFVHWIVKLSNLFIAKPWFLYILNIVFLIYLSVKKFEVGKFCMMMYYSALFYLLGLIAFGNAADTRLTFYTNTTILLPMFIVLYRFFKSTKVDQITKAKVRFL